MAGTTMMPYCGGCNGEMLMEQVDNLYRMVCIRCGYETPVRVTMPETAEDVRWLTPERRPGLPPAAATMLERLEMSAGRAIGELIALRNEARRLRAQEFTS